MNGTDVLLNVATPARLFHASDGTGFADLVIAGHWETWPLRSKRFQAWLRQQYYERTWDAPSPAALNAETAYSNNRRAATENIIDADPVAALVREMMADRAPRGAVRNAHNQDNGHRREPIA